jgi:hypothetical protein
MGRDALSMDEKQKEAQAIFSAMGLSPQAFPAYDTLPPFQFVSDTGIIAATAGAKISGGFNLDNYPRIALGLRIENVWQLPEDPSLDELALAEYVSRVVDLQQTVQTNLTTTNITVRNPVPQSIMMGTRELWHLFPSGFDCAGGNDFNFEITRLTSYPLIRDARINPKVYVSLVEIVLRGDRPAVRVQRVGS